MGSCGTQGTSAFPIYTSKSVQNRLGSIFKELKVPDATGRCTNIGCMYLGLFVRMCIYAYIYIHTYLNLYMYTHKYIYLYAHLLKL